MQLMPWKHDEEGLRMVDSTHIKVHRDGANPAGGNSIRRSAGPKRGLNTKLHIKSQGHNEMKAQHAGENLACAHCYR